MICELCGQNKAELSCSECQVNICLECGKYDLHSYGCGCIYPVNYCKKCVDDNTKNPYSSKK